MSTQERLIDLGEDLIRERGYGGFSYADLAVLAGIRKASIHHHFPTKADFGLAVLQRYAERVRDALTEFGKSRIGSQALYKLIEFYRDALTDGEQLCLCVALSGDVDTLSEETLETLSETNAEIADWIAQTLLTGRRDRSISVGGDPSEEAIAILAQLQGAQLIARAGRNVALFDHAVATLRTRLNRY